MCTGGEGCGEGKECVLVPEIGVSNSFHLFLFSFFWVVFGHLSKIPDHMKVDGRVAPVGSEHVSYPGPRLLGSLQGTLVKHSFHWITGRKGSSKDFWGFVCAKISGAQKHWVTWHSVASLTLILNKVMKPHHYQIKSTIFLRFIKCYFCQIWPDHNRRVLYILCIVYTWSVLKCSDCDRNSDCGYYYFGAFTNM